MKTMEKNTRNPKYKIGDKVSFDFDGETWVGTITDIYEYPSGWNYKIYDFWFGEDNIIGVEK